MAPNHDNSDVMRRSRNDRTSRDVDSEYIHTSAPKSRPGDVTSNNRRTTNNNHRASSLSDDMMSDERPSSDSHCSDEFECECECEFDNNNNNNSNKTNKATVDGSTNNNKAETNNNSNRTKLRQQKRDVSSPDDRSVIFIIMFF